MNGTDNKSTLVEWFRRKKGIVEYSEAQFVCLILADFIVFKNTVDLSVKKPEGRQPLRYIYDPGLKDKILSVSGGISFSGREQSPNSNNIDPEFRSTLVNTRLFQGGLRRMALEYYNHQCLLCGIDIDDLLVVSHIKDVSVSHEDAGNIHNTLLLCRLHDGMFDRKLISIDDDNRVIVGNILKKSRSSKLQTEIKELEDKSVENSLKESKEFLKWHRTKLQ